MTNPVITGIARTPIGKYGGALAPLRAVELGGIAIAGAIERSQIDPGVVDEVLFGHVLQAGEGQITARQAAVRGGLPMTVPSVTINKVCLSGLSAIGLAERIGIVARSDAVPRGKPFPDVFLHAAQALGVPAERCLAFEDAPVGVATARAAGMRCVAITSTFPADVFARTETPPDAAYPDFQAYLDREGRWLLS